MKLRFRPRSKDQSKALNPEPTPEKKPLVINYDKDGVRIGDDGYSMTPKRTRLHNMLNVIFVWGIICAVCGAACAILAYAQGQQYGGFEGDFATFDLELSGGNMIFGHSAATLMRVEAIVLLVFAVFGPTISIQGFHWFYDKRPATFTIVAMVIVAISAIVYEALIISTVGIPDPASIIMLIILALIALFMRGVAIERPTLKKAKIARTETKK